MESRLPPIDANTVAEFNRCIRIDPAGVVDSLRDAYTARIPFAHNQSLLSLLGCFLEALDGVKESGVDTPHGLWKAVLSAGLPELYQEMATAPDFLSEYPPFIESVLIGLSQMAARCEARAHASSRRALLDNAPAMFKSFWEHRDLIPRAASSATGGDLAVYTGIGQVLQRFITLYERVGVVPVTPATFIPHVGLCCWFNLEETSAWAQTGLFAMRFLTDPRTYHAVEPSVMFVQAGADAYGPEPLVKRFLKDVKSRSIPWVHIRVSLGLLSRFIAHSPFEPLIARYKIFDLFAEVGSRSLCEAPSSEAWIIWLECSSFLRCELDFMHGGLETGVFEASSRFLPVGREIFAMLACGIQQLIWRQRSTLEDFMPFRNPIQALVKVIRRCKQKPGQHSDAFRRDLKKEADRVWYPALRMLRTEQQRTSTGLGRSLPDAVELWTDLGAQLGLKELRERDRYEREGLSHCAWKLCRYHIENPESVLSACRGCGEARYCGRRCQTRDWKEGGHKAKCRRLK